GFSVSGLSGSINAIVTDDGAGNTTSTTVDLSNVTGLNGDVTLHGYGEYDTTTGTYANYAVQDGEGNMYKLDAGDIDTNTGAVTKDLSDSAAAQTAKDAYATDADAGLTATANPLEVLDNALSKVDNLRSDLGAIQNR